MVRRLIERISRAVVLKRNMPARYGGVRVFVTPDSALRYWHKDLSKVDPVLLRVADEFVQPGFNVWDVGANNGLFTFASASLAGPSGRVVAIEPDVSLCKLLQRSAASAKKSSSAPVDVICAAVLDCESICQLNIARRGRASNCVGDGRSQVGGVRETHSVVSVSLDWLLSYLPKPDLIKIDIEGAEAAALRGAEKILEVIRPCIICEVSGPGIAEITAILHHYDYRMFDGNVSGTQRQPLSTAVWNTIAFPK